MFRTEDRGFADPRPDILVMKDLVPRKTDVKRFDDHQTGPGGQVLNYDSAAKPPIFSRIG